MYILQTMSEWVCSINEMVLTQQKRKLGEKPYQGLRGPSQIPHGLLGAFSVRKGD
jgi:hypothetical protein